MLEGKINSVLKELKNRVLIAGTPAVASGLFSGNSGTLLFLTEYNNFFQEQNSADLLHNFAESINQKIKGQFRNHSLYAGTAGVFWAGTYLNKLLNQDNQLAIDTQIHPTLLKKAVARFLEAGFYDFLHGAGGIIKALALNGSFTREESKDLLRHFKNLSVKTENGISWHDRFYAKNSNQVHLGLAHGVSGLINVLADLVPVEQNPLLRPAIEDLYYRTLSEPEVNGTDFTCFSHRYSWCSSRIGPALILLKFTKVLGYKSEYDHIKQFIVTNLTQLPADSKDLQDLCLCHGSSGVITQLHLLYNEIKEGIIKSKLEALLTQTLNLYDKSHTSQPALTTFNQDMSVITGVSGLGLALLNLQKRNDFLLHTLNII